MSDNEIQLEDYYTISKWKGHDNFECSLCPFASVRGIDEMHKHLLSAHFPPMKPKVALVQAYDKSGRPIGPAPGEIREAAGKEDEIAEDIAAETMIVLEGEMKPKKESK